MKRFRNSRTESFVKSIPEKGVESDGENLSTRCKFNFHYFQPQPPGQAWVDWSHADLAKLLNKLQIYSENSLKYWENEHSGASGRVLSVYDSFPTKSDFCHPKAVPHDVRWARFRLEQKVRLVGFVVPSALDGRAHPTNHKSFCSNTFYVVFLDKDHRFYVSERA
ncbi:hypothetical protein [Stenotrophomonas lacuserhaii]|jgi:hypothetical protein|uniref:hypothetical protein n=1 Tax=Stenotrophomonas lacuserhaii TaxID=2760084 RepID=UPI0032EBA2D5